MLESSIYRSTGLGLVSKAGMVVRSEEQGHYLWNPRLFLGRKCQNLVKL